MAIGDIIVPKWFFGFDSAIYIFVAIVGFLITYYSYKTYSITAKKQHLFLYWGFKIISVGFLLLAITRIYSYGIVLPTCTDVCTLSTSGSAFTITDFGYWIYFAASLLAYLMFILTSMAEKIKLPIMFILPVWFAAFPYFHITSIFLMSFVVFNSILNFLKNKNAATLLVLLAFVFISIFHLSLIVIPINQTVYVFAHLFLLLGFLSFLFMLVKVLKVKVGK
ncbi:MAG: hypothetical protein HY512_02650 [Candidatus Aenigmarchaeota archaeon]|nr:hypothetical protein [Candidatus Aenigmarchaeota archaeon]